MHVDVSPMNLMADMSSVKVLRVMLRQLKENGSLTAQDKTCRYGILLKQMAPLSKRLEKLQLEHHKESTRKFLARGATSLNTRDISIYPQEATSVKNCRQEHSSGHTI